MNDEFNKKIKNHLINAVAVLNSKKETDRILPDDYKPKHQEKPELWTQIIYQYETTLDEKTRTSANHLPFALWLRKNYNVPEPK